MVEFHDVADAEPAVDAALAVGALALAKPGDVERLQRGLEGLPHGDVLEHLAGRHAVGQLGLLSMLMRRTSIASRPSLRAIASMVPSMTQLAMPMGARIGP